MLYAEGTVFVHIYFIVIQNLFYTDLFSFLFCRYLLAFWYGLKTRFTVPVLHSDYIRYLTEWRDITLLRLIEGFLEAAPQMILQLYILASQKEFILDRDWLTATSAVVSIISLSWAIVSYSQMLRLCLNDRALSFCGYGFQILYRLLMVASRVTVLVLFASAFKEYIFLVVVGHCAMMFAWLSCIDATHYSVDRDEPFLEKIFTLIVSVIYLFCFLSVHPATTKRHISIYYSITFVESAAMMSAWFPYRTLEGVLMYASFGLVFGGFFCGLLCMMLYYKYFHPNQDVTASWICCLWFSNDGGRGNSELEESTLKNVSFSYDDNDKELVVIKVRQRSGSQTGGQKTPDPDSGNRLSLPVELMRPHSPLKNRGDIDQIELEEVRDEKLKNVNGETLKCSSSFDRDKNHRTVFSDGELETCIDRGVLPRTGYVACSPANHGGRYFQHKERPKWEAHVSKTVMANAYCSYPEDGTIENKAKLGELKMGMELATTEWEVSNFDKNSNKLEKKRSTRSTKGEMFEQRPLLQRQGSKDDYFAINTSLFPVELQKHRRRSLSAMQ